jgi:cytochrome bd-type quinol oxidase subunit 2
MNSSLLAARIYNPIMPEIHPEMEDAPSLLGDTLNKIITLFFIVGGVAFFFMIVLGGIKWMTSGGDKEKLEGARKQITSAVVGLVVFLLIFAIINLIETLFGVNLLNFSLPTFGQ